LHVIRESEEAVKEERTLEFRVLGNPDNIIGGVTKNFYS